MAWISEPFFWVALGMFAMVGADSLVGSRVVARFGALGAVSAGVVSFSRVFLVLPFVDQPRWLAPGAVWVGIALILVGVALAVPIRKIRWNTGPNADEPLSTTGAFRFVRHPGYAGNVLWGLGWAVCFGSVIGIILTPFWIAAFYFHLLIEEESLIRQYGDRYLAYQKAVPARVIPGLHF